LENVGDIITDVFSFQPLIIDYFLCIMYMP